MSSSGPWISGLGLAAVLSQLPVAVVVVEAGSLRIVEFNDRARDMAERQLGQAVPEALEDWWEIFHADGRPYVLEERPVVRSMISGGEVDGEEYFSVLPDGSRMIVRSSSAPIYDDRGEIVAGVLVMEDVTGQRHMEEQLARHASLLENVEDAVVTIDREWLFRGWNQGAARMYGWSLEELLGKPASFVRMDRSDQQRAEIRREVVERGRWRGEATVKRKDGSTVTVEVISVAIGNKKGVSGILGIHRDITERKRAEDALREAQRGTETILESITDVFVAFDSDWRYIYVNGRGLDRIRKARGEDVPREKLLGRSVWDVFPEIVGTTVDHELHRAVREQRAVVFETYSPLTDMSVEVHAYPSKGGGVSFYSRDLTERRRAEEALREANRRSERILESIGDLFVAMDGEWRITYMNRRSVANTGEARGEDLSLDDLLGKSYWELFPEAVGTAIEHEFHRAVREQETVCFEIVGPLTGVWFDICVYPTDDGLSVYSRDITERKEAEQRVEEAREAERARIGRALHDEPLQGLGDAIALVRMAERTTAESRLADQLLPVLQRVGEQLRFAIYDLRLESKQQGPFVEHLERLVDEHQAMIGSVEIQLEIGDGIPSGSLGVEGIEVLRILGEALTNARRHANARRIRVRVWAANDGLRAEVSDDGRGFDTASPVSPIHRGITGMRERAELLHGRLELHSELGVGTTVRLEAALVDGTSGDT